MRAFQRDINDCITDRFELLERYKKRVAVWVMAKRAKQGIYTLPEDWFKCSFTKPREFTVDDETHAKQIAKIYARASRRSQTFSHDAVKIQSNF